MNFFHDGELYVCDGEIEDLDDFNLGKDLLPFILSSCPPNTVTSFKLDEQKDSNRYGILVPPAFATKIFIAILKDLGNRGNNLVVELLEAALNSPRNLKKEDVIKPKPIVELPLEVAPPTTVESIAPPPSPPKGQDLIDFDPRYFQSPSQRAFLDFDNILTQIDQRSPGSQKFLQEDNEVEEEEESKAHKKRRM